MLVKWLAIGVWTIIVGIVVWFIYFLSQMDLNIGS